MKTNQNTIASESELLSKTGDIQAQQAATSENSMIMDNESRHTLLEVSEHAERFLPKYAQKSVSCKAKSKWMYVLILLIISGIVSIVSIHVYTKSHSKTESIETNSVNVNDLNMDTGQHNNIIKSFELEDTSYRYGIKKDQRYGSSQKYKMAPPEEIGHMNIYLRRNSHKNNERSWHRHRFPVARYNHHRFPFHGPFISFLPKLPIYVERLTRQTIIYSSIGVYILPPLVNMYGKRFAVAEFLASGYASLVSTGAPINTIDVGNIFRPIPLIDLNIPSINPMTGGFTGGIRINYRWPSLPKLPHTLVNDFDRNLIEDDNYRQQSKYSEDKYKNPYYSRGPSCFDGVQNGEETQIDCGGPKCTGIGSCATGARCMNGFDCQSGVCKADICQASTCFDGVRNQRENQIDCGGPFCIGVHSCADGNPCRDDSDCQNSVCKSNICQGTSQPVITLCQADKPTASTKQIQTSRMISSGSKKPKIYPARDVAGSRVLKKNAYLIEFEPGTDANKHFQTVTRSFKTSHGIDDSAVKQRHTIHSPLFSGISISVPSDHPMEALEMIEGAIAVYPVYTIKVPQVIENSVKATTSTGDNIYLMNSHQVTNVDRVHKELNNYGKGVRVAVIDTGMYYRHPALGGCFGTGCKVAFGYDFVGDDTSPTDDDPFDNCDDHSHGTHVSGIIGANITGINETDYIPEVPFIGVAPQVTLGAYRVLGCDGSGSTDAVTAAIYRAHQDNADIINLSLGGTTPYPEEPDAIAVERVIEAGVYVAIAIGNDGDSGLQTGGIPDNAPSAMAVASIDSLYTVRLFIIAPDNTKIFYIPGAPGGGWQTTVNSTIVVNDPNSNTDDGCSGPSQNVLNVVVLFSVHNDDSCSLSARCNQAANAGAIGCLFYGGSADTNRSTIPSGIISSDDATKIITTVTQNSNAIYTFTNMRGRTTVDTGKTPSFFTSLGPQADLDFKPQLGGIGGRVYSTISPYAAETAGLIKKYNILSGTSMATPYTAGALALFLASIGNPAPSTTNGQSTNGICRPKFSVAINIFQSTAHPVNIYQSSLLATTAQQGAGLVNVYRALTTTAIFSPSQLSLNDTVRKAKSYTVNLWNIGNKAAAYTLSHRGAALATGKIKGDDQLLNTPIYSADYATVTISPTTIQVAPGKWGEITLQFEPPTSADPALLPIYSGLIYATDTNSGQAIHMSYSGMVGDYGEARILVRNASLPFVTQLTNAQNQNLFTQEMPTLNGTEGLSAVIVRAWATRLFFAEVFAYENETLCGPSLNCGFLYSIISNTEFRASNMPRNVANTRLRAFTPEDDLLWNGHVCPEFSDRSCSDGDATLLPSGQYTVRFSALKHFGNRTNPNDYDIYETPPFQLVY